MILARSLFLVSLLLLTACSAPDLFPFLNDDDDSPSKLEQPAPEEPAPTEPEVPSDGEIGALPPICSKLSFSQVTWPEDLTSNEQIAFSLSLNISGSFEGPSGWRNISNNFDGMGLSMGLLNQTLGTGSLQPLLISMRRHHYTIMQKQFANSRLQSVLGMLSEWEDAAPQNLSTQSEDSELPLSSLLDTDWQGETDFTNFDSSASPNTLSIAWAVATLYTESKKFKTDWKKDLQKLIGTSEYVSLQIDAAKILHARSKRYQARLKMKTLRSYLLMFDFVVQNGGITEDEFTEWDQTTNNTMTEKEKLKALLEIRIRRVRPQYVNDVRSRKSSIIEGTGRVHGENRDYQKEYCFVMDSRI